MSYDDYLYDKFTDENPPQKPRKLLSTTRQLAILEECIAGRWKLYYASKCNKSWGVLTNSRILQDYLYRYAIAKKRSVA